MVQGAHRSAVEPFGLAAAFAAIATVATGNALLDRRLGWPIGLPNSWRQTPADELDSEGAEQRTALEQT